MIFTQRFRRSLPPKSLVWNPIYLYGGPRFVCRSQKHFFLFFCAGA
ncbi:hypothetical protein PspLS_05640 [Pyricularia sp. CBS 133598]|nr:hypothetical protein PspLS_05640 [Pyricularia sp. CBS 133598]